MTRSDKWKKRPQAQERLTCQIAQKLQELLETDDVAVVIDTIHICVKTGGIKDRSSYTRTSAIMGKYKEQSARAELFSALPQIKLI